MADVRLCTRRRESKVVKSQVVFIRSLLACMATVLSLTRADAGGPPFDLHGTARAGGHALPDVVVWLEAPNLPAGTPAGKVVLDQRNLSFIPHVLAVRVGTIVDFPNDDRVFHNVFSFRDGKRFDLGMYPVGALRHVTFDKPGLSRIFCNIHPNMAAYVLAVDTPYFAVSDGSGSFTIAAVALRSYTYHAWRAGATELTGTWSPAGDATLTVDWR
jgi:plastocyanin